MNRTRALVVMIGGLILVALLALVAVLMMPSFNPESRPPDVPTGQPPEGSQPGGGAMCTLIGCMDGLTIRLVGDLPSPYTVEARWEGGSQTFRCTGDAASPGDFGCQPDGSIRIDGATPEEITVTVTWQSGRATETLRPTYETVYPNGPDCPPGCRQATVTMTLP